MYGLTAVKGLIKRGARIYGLSTLALAALILLSFMPAQAQEVFRQANVYTGTTTVYAGTLNVSLKRGQTLRIRIASTNNRGRGGSSSGGDDVIIAGPIMGHVKVFSASTGQVLYKTDEARILAGESRSFDINSDDLPARDVNDMYIFQSPNRRARVRVEVVIVVPATEKGQDGVPRASKFPTTYELVDKGSGKTILIGQLLPAIQKVR
jgi:hypothetical protein